MRLFSLILIIAFPWVTVLEAAPEDQFAECRRLRNQMHQAESDDRFLTFQARQCVDDEVGEAACWAMWDRAGDRAVAATRFGQAYEDCVASRGVDPSSLYAPANTATQQGFSLPGN